MAVQRSNTGTYIVAGLIFLAMIVAIGRTILRNQSRKFIPPATQQAK